MSKMGQQWVKTRKIPKKILHRKTMIFSFIFNFRIKLYNFMIFSETK